MPALVGTALYGAPAPVVPQGAALAEVVAGHYEDTLTFYGPDLGARVIRKHLGAYMDAAGTRPELRREVLTATSPRVVLSLLGPAFACEEVRAA